MKWQPIETAPADGARVLLLARSHHHMPRTAIADGFMANGRWVWPYIHKEPTHWMPIPEFKD